MILKNYKAFNYAAIKDRITIWERIGNYKIKIRRWEPLGANGEDCVGTSSGGWGFHYQRINTRFKPR